jgi:hypothetical protein
MLPTTSVAFIQAAGDHVVYVAMGTVVVLTEQQVGSRRQKDRRPDALLSFLQEGEGFYCAN